GSIKTRETPLRFAPGRSAGKVARIVRRLARWTTHGLTRSTPPSDHRPGCGPTRVGRPHRTGPETEGVEVVQATPAWGPGRLLGRGAAGIRQSGGRCASRPVRRNRGGRGSACALRSDYHEVNPVALQIEDPVDRLRREEPDAIDLAAAVDYARVPGQL